MVTVVISIIVVPGAAIADSVAIAARFELSASDAITLVGSLTT